MLKNPSPFAVVQIGAGVICIMIAVGGFLLKPHFIQALSLLFLGAGNLLYGLSNNSSDTSERGRRLSQVALSQVASASLVVCAVLSFYNAYFDSK